MKKIVCLFGTSSDCFDLETDEAGSTLEWHHFTEYPTDGHLYVCPSFFLPELKQQLPYALVACYGTVAEMGLAFEGGAVEYFRTPCSVMELILRARRLLGAEPRMFSWGMLTCTSAQVVFDGLPLDLGVRECQVLTLLAHNPGKVFSKTQIETMLESQAAFKSRIIDVYISRVRQALWLASLRLGKPVIQSVYGKGYFLVE